MTRIHGAAATTQIIENFRTISPGYADYVVESGFAEIYDRPALTLAQRQLLNVAILTTLGDTAPQLATHIRGALNVGVTPEQVIETIIHTSLYAGHPRVGAALAVAQDVLTTQPREREHQND